MLWTLDFQVCFLFILKYWLLNFLNHSAIVDSDVQVDACGAGPAGDQPEVHNSQILEEPNLDVDEWVDMDDYQDLDGA